MAAGEDLGIKAFPKIDQKTFPKIDQKSASSCWFPPVIVPPENEIKILQQIFQFHVSAVCGLSNEIIGRQKEQIGLNRAQVMEQLFWQIVVQINQGDMFVKK